MRKIVTNRLYTKEKAREILSSLLVRLIEDHDIWAWLPTGMALLPKIVDITSGPFKEAGLAGCIPLLGDTAEQNVSSFILHSQLRTAFLIKNPDNDDKIDCFAYPEDIQMADKCPVLLASALKRPKEEKRIEIQRSLPPAEHGTIGMIISREKQTAYNISELPPKSQELQKRISQMLEEQTEQNATILGSEGNPLRLVFKEVGEIQAMVQQLAQDYYQYHQNREQTPKKRAIPHTPNLFENGFAETASCLPIQAVIAGIQDAKSALIQWKQPKDHAPYFHYEKPKGTAIVEYKTGEKNEVFDDKTTASLWRQVKQFSDEDADVVLALFAHLIRPSENDGTTWFMASQYLDYRGVKPKMQADTPGGHKRRAGHRQEDIKAVGDSVGRIENIWITLSQWIDETSSGKKKRKRTEFTHKGRLLMVEEAYTQRELPDGDKESDPGMEIGWRIRPGSWLRTFLENPNRQVANLCQKSLQYDPYREQWEKRLSRYFMFHGHINTHGGGGTFNREIGKLFQEVSLSVEKDNPQRTRNRFEKAMNILVTDKIIQEWYYEAEFSLPARGWLATWLEQKITIHIAPTRYLKA